MNRPQVRKCPDCGSEALECFAGYCGRCYDIHAAMADHGRLSSLRWEGDLP